MSARGGRLGGCLPSSQDISHEIGERNAQIASSDIHPGYESRVPCQRAEIPFADRQGGPREEVLRLAFFSEELRTL